MSNRASVTLATAKRDIRAESVTFSPDRDNRDKGGVGGVNYDRKGVVLPSGFSNVTGECHARMSRSECHVVTVGERDSDRPSSPSGRVHHGHESARSKPKLSWMHIAAVNLIADHKAGIAVNKVKLSAAFALMADYDAAIAQSRLAGAAA